MFDLEGRNILSIKDLDREQIEHIFEMAEKMEPIAKKRGKTRLLADKILATLFFHPSTRTRLSFESAMQRLGGSVLGFANPEVSRAGDWTAETLTDTARMVNNYADVVAVRHFQSGAIAEYASASEIPVINCGDGTNEHPTQGLTDLYTIKKEKGKIDGTNVLIMAKSTRATHSLCYGLSMFNDVRIYHFSPENVRLPQSIKEHIRDSGIVFKEITNIGEAMGKADVIYVINVWPYDKSGIGRRSGKVEDKYRLGLDKLGTAKEGLIVLHPLPRLDELPTEVDNTPYSRYFEQAANGVYIRMALLALVLGKRP